MALATSKTCKRLLILAAGLACYGNTISHDYAYDDAVVITENQFTQQGIAGIAGIFKHNTFAGSYENVPTLARYRPLSLATFAIERELFGPSPHASHFDNVWLFALTALVLYLLLAKLFATQAEPTACFDLPFVAALLFAVHPIHTEVVANIKGRDEILVLAGALSATLFVLEYLDSHKLRNLLLAFVCFLVALFSKENAVTFLAVVPLTVFYYQRRKRVDYVWSLLPLLVASACFLVVRRSVLGPPGAPPPADILTDPFAYADLSQRLATVGYTLGGYLKLLCFPHPLTIDYYPFHIRLADWGSGKVWLALAAHVGLAVYAAWGLRRRSLVAYGILFYLITLSVVSNLPFSLGTFMSERFLFVPSVGFAIVMGRLLTHRALAPLRYRPVIVLALALACAGKTCSRNAVWKDDFTLFTTDVATSADSIKANLAAALTYLLESHKSSLGAEYRAKGLAHAQRAVALYRANVDLTHVKATSYVQALMLLGNAYAENGMLEDALRCYRDSFATAPNRAALEHLVETAINQSSDVDFKIRSYADFVQLAPDSFSFNYHLGLLYGRDKQDLPMSIVHFRRAVDLEPHHVGALRGLAHAYTLSRNFDQAALCFEQLVGQDPHNPAMLRSLGDLYRRAGDEAKAAAVAQRLEPLETRPEP
jgi:protein O-mannosyl-transferase